MSLVWSPSRCCLENRRYPCPSPPLRHLKWDFFIDTDDSPVRELLIMRIAPTGTPLYIIKIQQFMFNS